MAYRYLIQCQRMCREEAFVARDFHEFMRYIEQYVLEYGPVDMIYNVGRA